MNGRYSPPPLAPKQHHFVPKVYLEAFANTAGFLWVLDLWQSKTFTPRPSKALRAGGLYNQPVHNERRYDASLETFFGLVETRLPELIRHLERGEALNETVKGTLVEFLCMMRVRVPNTLKAATRLLASLVEADEVSGEILMPAAIVDAFKEVQPQLPLWTRDAIFLKDLIDCGLVYVPIDPHRALAAMPSLVISTAPYLARAGALEIVRNESGVDFITSDNPVIYFTREGDNIVPYPTGSADHFELLVPLTPKLAVWSSTGERRVSQRTETNPQAVSGFNELVALFADRFVVSREPLPIPQFRPYANICPVPNLATSQVLASGDVISIGYQLGSPIKDLPTFEYEDEGDSYGRSTEV